MKLSRLLRLVAILALLGVFVVTSPANAQYKTWSFEVLDGFVPADPHGQTDNAVGTYNSVILYQGQPHVFTYDDTDGQLRHGWWNGSFWSFEALDGFTGSNGRTDNDVGADSSVVIFNGQLHVFYRDVDFSELRHAWWNGSFWSFEALDGFTGSNGRTDNAVGYYTSVTIFDAGPHVWYYDATDNQLRHAWWNGSFWSFEALDGFIGSNGRTDNDVGLYTAVLIFAGGPHVWYFDDTADDLRHAWWNGSAWFFETLDGHVDSQSTGQTSSAAGSYNAVLLYLGQPHVFNFGPGTLRQGWWNGARWNFETLDGFGGSRGESINSVGSYNAALIFGGEPHNFYFDAAANELRHAWYGAG